MSTHEDARRSADLGKGAVRWLGHVQVRPDWTLAAHSCVCQGVEPDADGARCMRPDDGLGDRRLLQRRRGRARRRAGHRRDRRGTPLPLGGRDVDARRAAPSARGPLRPGDDPLPDARGWAEYSVMLISSAEPPGPRPTVTFIAPTSGPKWSSGSRTSRRPRRRSLRTGLCGGGTGGTVLVRGGRGGGEVSRKRGGG